MRAAVLAAVFLLVAAALPIASLAGEGVAPLAVAFPSGDRWVLRTGDARLPVVWETVDGASYYAVFWRKAGSDEWVTLFAIGWTKAVLDLSELSPGIPGEVQITAYDRNDRPLASKTIPVSWDAAPFPEVSHSAGMFTVSGADRYMWRGQVFAADPDVPTMFDANTPTGGFEMVSAERRLRGASAVSTVLTEPAGSPVELTINSPSENENVENPFVSEVSLSYPSWAQVEELRFSIAPHTANNPDAVVPVSGNGTYSAELEAVPGEHTLTVYAVDYGDFEPIGYDSFWWPGTGMIIRAQASVDFIVTSGIPGGVTITSPHDGDVFTTNETITVSWTYSGTVDHFEVGWVVNGAEPNPGWHDVGTTTSYELDLSGFPTCDLRIYVKAVFADGNESIDSVLVTVVSVEFSFVLENPEEGGIYYGSIPFRAHTSELAPTDYYVVKVGDETWTFHTEYTGESYEASGSFKPTQYGDLVVIVEAYYSGTLYAFKSVNVTHYAPSLSVEITSPSDGSTVSPSFTLEWTVEGVVASQTIYLDGVLAANPGPDARSFDFSGVSVGEHEIEIDVSGQNETAQATVTFYVYNGVPSPRILSPEDGWVIQPDYVIFRWDWGIPYSEREHLEYKLENYDTDWITETSPWFNSVIYWLDEGSYTFYLKVYDIDGHVGQAQVSITVSSSSGGGGSGGGGSGGGGSGDDHGDEREFFGFISPSDGDEVDLQGGNALTVVVGWDLKDEGSWANHLDVKSCYVEITLLDAALVPYHRVVRLYSSGTDNAPNHVVKTVTFSGLADGHYQLVFHLEEDDPMGDDVHEDVITITVRNATGGGAADWFADLGNSKWFLYGVLGLGILVLAVVLLGRRSTVVVAGR